MTKFAQTARHVAMALSVLFAALAILVGQPLPAPSMAAGTSSPAATT